MLLIEKNVDLSELYKRPFPWYILGFTLLGVGLGFFIPILIVNVNRNLQGRFTFLISVVMSVTLGAIGMIIGHSIEQKKKALRG
jgi:MFS family permease